MNPRTLALTLALCGLAAGSPPPQDPASPPPKQYAPKPDQPVPGLDDLLGLTPDKPSRVKPTTDPSKAELERKLSLTEAAEQFKEAVDLMGQAAARLGDGRDTGLATQRMQESIVRKLDMLIKAAEQQQSQRRQSSSSTSPSDQDRRNQPNQPTPDQRNQEQPGENRSELMPPGRRDGPLNPDVLSRGGAWGALPARIRDALFQGTQDTYSSVYQRLTETYFRKLAEEPP
jgi:hypothetical protein